MAASNQFWWEETEKVGLTVTTQPTEEPVTIAEVKDHSRIDGNYDDSWILGAIKAARMLGETLTKRCFVTTGLTLTLDKFPAGEFYLYRPRLQSVAGIKYYENGVQQTLSSSAYTIDTSCEPGRVKPIDSWPSADDRLRAVEISYVAGYGSANDVPMSIKQAILFTVSEWFRNRESEGRLPDAAKVLFGVESWGFLP